MSDMTIEMLTTFILIGLAFIAGCVSRMLYRAGNKFASQQVYNFAVVLLLTGFGVSILNLVPK